MNKKFIIGFSFLMASMSCFAQLPTVVSAPIAEGALATSNTILGNQQATLTGMNAVITSLEAAESQYKRVLENAQWLRQMNTARKLVFLMENLICTTKNLNMRLSLADQSCFYQFSFDVNLVKIEMAADYMGILLTSGVSFTAGERMRTLNDVVIAFEAANRSLAELNAKVDRALSLRISNDKVAANVRAVNSRQLIYR